MKSSCVAAKKHLTRGRMEICLPHPPKAVMGFYYVATCQRMFVNAEHNVEGAFIFVRFFDFYPSIHCYFVLNLGVPVNLYIYTHSLKISLFLF